jgi:hypothetical protein
MDKLWFEGSHEIDCSIQQVKKAFESLGMHYIELVGLMPGISTVELVDEGIMRRTNITKKIDVDELIVEFDEEYKAGRMINAKSHIVDEFARSGEGVKHRTIISGVNAPGFVGFFYQIFGSKNIGNAFLKSYKKYFEKYQGMKKEIYLFGVEFTDRNVGEWVVEKMHI